MSKQLLTWREATTELGWPDGDTDAAGRRLKRAVLAREAQTGKQIATRLSTGPAAKLRVTMSAIMRHMPELRRSRVDRLTEALADYNSDTDRRIKDLVSGELAEYVEPRLEELWDRDEKLATEIEGVARRVNGLSRAVSRIERRRKDRPQSTTIDQG